MMGIVAMVRVLALMLARKVKQHIVKYVLSLALKGHSCLAVSIDADSRGTPYHGIVDPIDRC